MARKPANAQADTLQDIRDGAFALFGRYGYDGVSIDDIAKAAGLSKGALYWHFKGKDQLFLDCLKRLHALKREVHPLLNEGEFSDQEGFELEGHDPESVLAKSYLGAERVAVVVINTSGEPREATVNFAEPATTGVTTWQLGREHATRDAKKAIALRLDPYDVVVLACDRSTEGSQ